MNCRFINLNLTILLFLFALKISAQNPALYNQYRYLYSDSPRLVYAGKIIGMNSSKYDSTFKNSDWEFLTPITKSNYPIEIRFKSGSKYGVSPLSCTILYYDTAFKINRFLRNGKSTKINLRADAVYNIIVQNAVFSLEQFEISNFATDTATLFNGKMWYKKPYEKMFSDHDSWYFLEYKVGNSYNRIYINLLYHHDFPDNQILRRYAEIKRAFTSDL